MLSWSSLTVFRPVVPHCENTPREGLTNYEVTALEALRPLIIYVYYDHSGLLISEPFNFDDPVSLPNMIAGITLGNLTNIGYDPTIHISHPLPTQNNGPDPIGWLLGPDGEKYDVLGILWVSNSFVGRGTICYQVRDQATGKIYALKDHWVEISRVDHESDILASFNDIPGIPKLIRAWNVQFQDHDDTTSRIRQHFRNLLAESKMSSRIPPYESAVDFSSTFVGYH